MSSGDFNNLVIRKATAYNPDGSFIKDGYVFTVSSNGKQNWTPDLKLNNLVLSTFTLNSELYVGSSIFDRASISTLTASTITTSSLVTSTFRAVNSVTCTLTASTLLLPSLSFDSIMASSIITGALTATNLIGSTIQTTNLTTSNFSFSTLTGSTLTGNTLTGNIFTVYSTLSGSTILTTNLTFNSANGSTLTANSLTIQSTILGSTITTSTLIVQNALTTSTLTGSTLVMNSASVQSSLTVSTMNALNITYSTIQGSTLSANTAIVNSSLVASTVNTVNITYSTLQGSTLGANTMIIQSTLVGSTINAVNITYSTFQGSTFSVNTMILNSTLVGSTLNMINGTYSTFQGSSLNANTVVWNSTLIGSTLNAMYVTYSTLQGSTIAANSVTIQSTLTASTVNAINMSYSTLQGDAIQSQSIVASTLTGSTINFANLSFSTLVASTMTANVMFPQSLIGSTMNISNLLTVSSNVGIRTTSANYPLTVSNTTFTSMELNRASTTTNNFYAAGTVYSVTNPSTSFRGEYAYAYGGASVLATTTQSQAVGYYAIDVANAGVFSTNTVNGPSGATFYMDPTKTYFQNTSLGVGTTSPSWLLTAAKDIPFSGMTLNPMDAQLVISGRSNTGVLKIGTYYTNGGPVSLGAALQCSNFSGSVDTPAALVLNPLGGNVGVGTATPGAKLDVNGQINSVSTITISNAYPAVNGYMRMTASTSVNFIQSGLTTTTDSKADLVFGSINAGSEWMRIKTTGSVGIGTTNPGTSLEVYTNNGVGGTTQVNITSMAGGATTTNTSALNLKIQGAGGGTVDNIISAQYNSTDGGNYSLAFKPNNGTTVMTVVGNGNVGIGTTTPSFKMDIWGPAVAGDVTRHSMLLLARSATSGVQNNVSSGFFTGANVSTVAPYGALDIRCNGLPVAGNTYGAIPNVTVMSIIGNGNVGIGITNPSSTLDVNGTAAFSSTVSVYGALYSNSTFYKNGTTAGYYMSVSGGTSLNSPYLEFYVNGTRKCYIGNSDSTYTYIAAENSSGLIFTTAGVTRLTINSAGNAVFSGSIFCTNHYSPNGNRALVLNDTNEVNYIYQSTGPTPVTFAPTTWNNNGFTVITRTALASGADSSGLGFAVSPGRAVIVALKPGSTWNEMILSGGTIYTSCYGTINNYTDGGSWVFSSDKRVKRDIKPIKTTRSLERIMCLKPVTYKKIYNSEKSSVPIPEEVLEADHIGFLAQDVLESNPHCVNEWIDENSITDDDDGKRLGIAYGDINIHAVGAIQEQQKQICDLKKQLDVQSSQIAELTSLVQQLLNK